MQRICLSRHWSLDKIRKRENAVVVIRHKGPKGGPGMPEMLKPGPRSQGDGRWVIRAGGGWDVIGTNEESRALNLLVEPEVSLVRRGKWEVGEKMMEPRVKRSPLESMQS
jgi:hypothetical protein